MVTLDRLIRGLEVVRVQNLGDKPVTIQNICYDSRRLRPGDLFVAVNGFKDDGHRYIEEVIARGAAGILAERTPRLLSSVPLIQVKDSRLALAQASAALYRHLARVLKVIGVTGSVGKTSTTYMIRSILESAGFRPGLIGSLGVRIGRTTYPNRMTTPEAPELHGYLREMVDRGCDHAVLEVSSHGLELKRVAGMSFDYILVTSLVEEHLDFDGSLAEYVKVKQSIFNLARPDCNFSYNADDSLVRTLVRRIPLRKHGFSIQGKAHATRAKMLKITPRGSEFLIKPSDNFKTGSETTFPVRLSLLGRNNVVNALAASTLAMSAGIDPTHITRGLRNLKPLRRRLEPVMVDGLRIFDDTSGLPASLDGVFETVSLLDYVNLYVIFAIRGNRGVYVNRQNARTLAKWANRLDLDTIYVTSSNSETDEANRVREEETRAFVTELHHEGATGVYFPDLRDAVRDILLRSGPEDLILLLGAQGMDEGTRVVETLATELRDKRPLLVKD